MTDQQTTAQDEGLRKLMDLLHAYQELHSLLPDKTCHRLLGYINADFEQALPGLMKAMCSDR